MQGTLPCPLPSIHPFLRWQLPSSCPSNPHRDLWVGWGVCLVCTQRSWNERTSQQLWSVSLAFIQLNLLVMGQRENSLCAALLALNAEQRAHCRDITHLGWNAHKAGWATTGLSQQASPVSRGGSTSKGPGHFFRSSEETVKELEGEPASITHSGGVEAEIHTITLA